MGIQEETKTGIRRAFIIDDDNLTQFISRIMIEQTGLIDVCIPHYNGATALQMLTNEQVGCLPLPVGIFLDLNMPVMDGFEFLEELNKKAELSFLLRRIIVLSSSSCARDVAKVSQLGVRWMLNKPLSIQAVSSILMTLIQENEQKRTLQRL